MVSAGGVRAGRGCVKSFDGGGVLAQLGVTRTRPKALRQRQAAILEMTQRAGRRARFVSLGGRRPFRFYCLTARLKLLDA